MIHEEWRDIPNYEGFYQVSDQGRVRSCDRYVKSPRLLHTDQFRKSQLISMCPDKDGYLGILLHKEAKRKSCKVHCLVMLAFEGERPNKYDINHINGIKNDNRFVNLEYCTSSENRLHAFRIGLQPQGEKHPHAKFIDADIIKIRNLYALGGITHKEISEMYGVSRAAISYIIRRESWKHL
jgi:hypothetical protein